MPKIEFTTHNGLLPVGLNHQIGFGFTSTRLIEDKYSYRILDYYFPSFIPIPLDEAVFEKNFYNYVFRTKKDTYILY